MTFLLFGSAHQISNLFLFLFYSAAGAVFVAAFILLYSSLNEHASPDFLIASSGGRFWGAAGSLSLAAFLLKSCELFYPVRDMGARLWPAPYGMTEYVRHASALAFLGAFSFWVAARDGPSGRLEGWGSLRFSKAWLRVWLIGAGSGLGFGIAGSYAHHWLFLGWALRKAGYPFLAYGALAGVFLLLPVCAAFLLWCLLPSTDSQPQYPWLQRAGLTAIVFGGLILPAHLLEWHLRFAWDYGLGDLSRAAGILGDERAGMIDVLVLLDKNGSPGPQAERVRLAASGADASRESLEKIRKYLDHKSFRSLFSREGVAALREGWALHWDLERYLDAAALHGRQIEPDYERFLSAVRDAPITLENYERLANLAEYAAKKKFIRVDQAQRIYEGFSAAYAHFGEMTESNLWLDKITGLLPLLTQEVRVATLEHKSDCAILGKLRLKGGSPSGVKVGLFIAHSSSAALGAQEGLVDSAYPDEAGEFGFDHLTPGRYYLALQAESSIGISRLRVSRAPGVLRLSADIPLLLLPPIDIGEKR